MTRDRLIADIRANFVRACDTLYWIRPRATTDPETGEEIPATEGLLRLHLYPEQDIMAEAMLDQERQHRPVRIIKVKPRQSGDSTLAGAWTFHHYYWKPYQGALVVAHHDTTTTSLYEMHQTFYGELPPELQFPTKKLNRKELHFEAPWGSRLVAQTAGYLDLGHGLTIQHCHLSEIDRWLDAEVALEGILETIADAAGTSIIIESVAQEANGWLHGFWLASKRGETGFLPLFTPWYKVPEYRAPVPPDWERTPEEVAWAEEYHLSEAQLAWYRNKKKIFIAKEPWGGERRLKAMYPFNDEECFVSSGFCVFPDYVLAKLKEGVRPPIKTLRLEPMPFPGQFREVPSDGGADANYWVYRLPEAGRSYVIGLDVAEGVGASESTVEVLGYPGYEQCAEFASNRWPVDMLAFAARYIAQQYRGQECILIPEVNKSGKLVVYILNNMETAGISLFRWRYLDRLRANANPDPQLGWETNEWSKKYLVQVANMVFLRGDGLIHSAVLHEQMTRCVDLDTGTRRKWAATGGRSDRVLGWLIAIVGAFLDLEGQSMMFNGRTIASDREREVRKDDPEKWVDPSRYDTDLDRIFEPTPMASMVGSTYLPGDFGDR